MSAYLQRLYAKVPNVACKGLCYDSCGPIPLARREQHLVKLTSHVVQLEIRGQLYPTLYDEERRCCPFLTEEKRCGIRDERPMLCRLWGTTPEMPCVFGCVPDREITAGMTRKLLKATE